MKTIVVMFSFIFLFSCETKNELKLKQSATKLIKSNPLKGGDLKTVKTQSEHYSNSCYYDNLSNQFNASVEVNQINEDFYKISIEIFDKTSKKIIDSIVVQSEWLIIPLMFSDCLNVRSLSTGVNVDKEIIDNEFGDFIVADFNFDNRDDLAIAVDFGGNGGTIYTFYSQKSNGKFELDQFLSETMLRFPISFDNKNRTLTTSVHANAFGNNETVFQLKNGKWKQISEKYVNFEQIN